MVIALGAFTRLVDAGLGCPDWPTCYGHVLWPQSEQEVATANSVWPEMPVNSGKPSPEMVHRYFASSLGLVAIVIALIAIPLLIQSYGIFIIAYGWAYLWRVPFNTAAPAALIGTSNFFELAVAVAISLFGLNSGAALATVVGVLVEVPVMLSLVAVANRTRHLFGDK